MTGQILPFISRRAHEQPWVLDCSNCKMSFRVQNLTAYTMATRIAHCPGCGSDSVKETSDYVNDRWYAMAKSFGLPSSAQAVQLLKDMYDLWDPSEYKWFKDFVADYIKDIIDKQEQAKEAE